MSCGDPICKHGNYALLCGLCRTGQDADWPPITPQVISAFRSTLMESIGLPQENLAIRERILELEEQIKHYQTNINSPKIFHHCQSRAGSIKTYPQLLCSCCSSLDDNSNFDALEELKRLMAENKSLLDAVAQIQDAAKNLDPKTQSVIESILAKTAKKGMQPIPGVSAYFVREVLAFGWGYCSKAVLLDGTIYCVDPFSNALKKTRYTKAEQLVRAGFVDDPANTGPWREVPFEEFKKTA